MGREYTIMLSKKMRTLSLPRGFHSAFRGLYFLREASLSSGAVSSASILSTRWRKLALRRRLLEDAEVEKEREGRMHGRQGDRCAGRRATFTTCRAALMAVGEGGDLSKTETERISRCRADLR